MTRTLLKDHEPSTGTDSAYEAAFQAVRQTYLLVSERFEKELAEAGLPDLGFYGVLLALSQSDEPVRPRDLLCRVNVTKSGLSRLVDRIEKAGLLDRTSCPSDRRGTFLVITDEGRETLARIEPVRDRVFRESFVEQVDPEDAAIVARVLGEVSSGIYETLNADGSCEQE